MKVDDRLNAIEKDLAEIKAAVTSSRPPRVVRLKGLWKGLKVEELTWGGQKVPLQTCLRLDSSKSFILKQLKSLLSLPLWLFAGANLNSRGLGRLLVIVRVAKKLGKSRVARHERDGLDEWKMPTFVRSQYTLGSFERT